MRASDKEALRDFLDTDAYPAMLELLENGAAAREACIIKHNLDDSSDPTKLLILKARAEGARQLAAAIKQQLESLRPKSKP